MLGFLAFWTLPIVDAADGRALNPSAMWIENEGGLRFQHAFFNGLLDDVKTRSVSNS